MMMNQRLLKYKRLDLKAKMLYTGNAENLVRELFIHHKVFAVKSTTVDRATIQFWNLLAKGHST